jgi:hypothetical protein
MDSMWGSSQESGIGGNSLIMSGMRILVGNLFPIRFRSEEKSSPKSENGDGDGDIFLRWWRVWEAILRWKIPCCHLYFLHGEEFLKNIMIFEEKNFDFVRNIEVFGWNKSKSFRVLAMSNICNLFLEFLASP